MTQVPQTGDGGHALVRPGADQAHGVEIVRRRLPGDPNPLPPQFFAQRGADLGQQGVGLDVGPRPGFRGQVALAVGASPIIVTGTSVDGRRLELARELGANLAVNVETDDPVATVRELTAGEGVPLVVVG